MSIRTVVKGAVLGGLVVYVASVLSWVAVPWHHIRSFTNEREVVSVLQRNAPESGLYMLPHCEKKSDTAPAGPLVFGSINYQRTAEMTTSSYVIGLLTQIVAAGIVTFILLHLAVTAYARRVFFAGLLGFLIGWDTAIGKWNWVGFPGSSAVVDIAHYTIIWALGGLVIAAVLGRHAKKKRS